MCEEPVRPLPGVGVQGSIEVVFADGLGVDDVGHTLHAFQPLQGLQQHPPGHALATSRGPHHHQAVIDLGDLIELENLQGQRPARDHPREGQDALQPLLMTVSKKRVVRILKGKR